MRTRINKTNEHRRCCEPARPYGALDQPMFPPRAIEGRHASQRTQPAFVQYLREAAPCQRGPPALCNRRLSAKQGSVQVTRGGHARVVDKVAEVRIGNKIRITLQSFVLHPLFENEKYKEDGRRGNRSLRGSEAPEAKKLWREERSCTPLIAATDVASAGSCMVRARLRTVYRVPA